MTGSMLDTPLAIVEAISPQRIEARIKPGSRLDVAGLAALLEARRRLAQGGRCTVLVEAPADLDFELEIMLADHYANVDASAFTRAMAIVYPGSLFHRLVKLYLAHRKDPFPYRLFTERGEAEAWLDQVEQGAE